MPHAVERQLTFAPHGHILTNVGVWSPDGRSIVYDIRSDPAGAIFDGTRIESVDVAMGKITVLYESGNGACCGVASFSPVETKVAFIPGPENPTSDWQYSANHRQGVIVDVSNRGIAKNLDARDLCPPFTPGALRGGSHVHIFSGDGKWISFTYQDHLLAQFKQQTPDCDIDLRNVGVSIPIPVKVLRNHPRNHDGEYFSVLVTQTTANPKRGSDEISQAVEEAWVGVNGYLRPDGSRQNRGLAFLGRVATEDCTAIDELFIVDLPDDLTIPGDGPLAGTQTRRPFPPKGVAQRRLTRTAHRKFSGLQGPRHWPRSAPDGSRIAFLMRDDAGVVQIWTISPNGGEPSRLTSNRWDIASAFTWCPDGNWIAHVMDNCVCITDSQSGETRRLTERCDDSIAPRPEACVFSPDGRKVAYVRAVRTSQGEFNQIFCVDVA
ncbi:MAG TPA: DUF3748 domain-containing protein [Humisphaera sp.]|nr:DUF3748 domain-containing protein [Humisphaera sp.]